MAPAESWVEQLPIPEPDPDQRERPFQALLITNQSRYGADHHDHFVETAVLVQNAQGLQALGNIILPWQPEQSDLIIHKVQIRRGDTVVDLLANGGRFTVLRRENNLEAAILDGMQTAVMQAEGLAAGDILDVAFTIRRRAGALPLRGENTVFAAPGMTVRRLYARQIWPASMTMQWRGTGPFDDAELRTTALGKELVADLRDIVGPQPPELAPPRFSISPMLQVSEYRDWAEISAIVAPHYDRAATLSSGSPLQAEIDRIARETSDPAARAMAALRLVQEEIRYFALVMGDGNYLPASAEETWTRRYGDCKAKTVMLVALLRGLGIEAEPMLVNAAIGDGVPDLLPQFSAFNHVIVRATIGGRIYLLDGTRRGDRDLAALASSRFGWGLPVRHGGTALERLAFTAAGLPDSETRVTYDASRGLLGSVLVTGEIIFRGDFATAARAVQAQGGDDAVQQMARNAAATYADEDDLDVAHAYDDQRSIFTIRFSGNRTLDWSGSSGSGSVAYEFQSDMAAWNPDFERDEGSPGHDVPFLLPPAYLAFTETVILPNEGVGFSISGENVDRTIAGVHLSRTLTLEDGRVTARSAFRPLQVEVAAAEAAASLDALREIRDGEVRVRGPAGLLTQSDRQVLEERTPTTADEFVGRGYTYMQAGSYGRAIEDFERAAALSPEWSLPLANQGLAEVHRGNFEAAERLFARAATIDPDDFVIHQGRGLQSLRQGEPEEAVRHFSRSLSLDAENVYSIARRAEAYARLGRLDDALADAERIGRIEPDNSDGDALRATIFAHLDQREQALAAIDAAIARDADNPGLRIMKGDLLMRFGRRAEAAPIFEQAIEMADAAAQASNSKDPLSRAIMIARMGRTQDAITVTDAHLRRYPDNVRALALRCWLRAEANVETERALRDCEEALDYEPGHDLATSARALLYLRMERWADAIRDFDLLIEHYPQNANALYGRGLARLGGGDREGAERDFTSAEHFAFDVMAEFTRLGFAAPQPVQAVAGAAAGEPQVPF